MVSKTGSTIRSKRASLTVCSRGKGDFRSLPLALSHLEVGGVVTLLPGRYILQGNLPVSATIVAKEQGTSIAIPRSLPVDIAEVSLTLQGVSLNECGNARNWLRGHDFIPDRNHYGPPLIRIKSGGELESHDCEWTHSNGRAVEAAGGRVTSRNCLFRDCEEGAVLLTGDARGEFVGCSFVRGWCTQLLFSGQQLDVRDCRFQRGQEHGLRVQGGSARIENCRFEDNEGEGAVVDTSGRGQFYGCVFTGNDSGLLVTDLTDVTAFECQFVSNTDGLRSVGQSDVQVERCEFKHNKNEGIFAGSTRTLRARKCTFSSNGTVGVAVVDGQTQLIESVWTEPSEGNEISEEENVWKRSEPTQKGQRVAVRVEGEYANLVAQGCCFQKVTSIEINNSGRASFFKCRFEQIKRSVAVSDGAARFFSCVWTQAQLVALAARGTAEIKVVESRFEESDFALAIKDSAQITLKQCTFADLREGALMAVNTTRASFESCILHGITGEAIDLFHQSHASLNDCRFENVGMALHARHHSSFSANNCDFSKAVALVKAKKNSKPAKSRIWDLALSDQAMNDLEAHVRFKGCTFPSTD